MRVEISIFGIKKVQNDLNIYADHEEEPLDLCICTVINKTRNYMWVLVGRQRGSSHRGDAKTATKSNLTSIKTFLSGLRGWTRF